MSSYPDSVYDLGFSEPNLVPARKSIEKREGVSHPYMSNFIPNPSHDIL
jgi:hypothetical protein